MTGKTMTAGDLLVVAEASYRSHHTLDDQQAQRPFPSGSPPLAMPPTSNFLQPLLYSATSCGHVVDVEAGIVLTDVEGLSPL